jgi:hypothetical protein
MVDPGGRRSVHSQSDLLDGALNAVSEKVKNGVSVGADHAELVFD